ncbi:MAG: NAD(P)/FAD-dependent oxidoreductase, partial [Methanosarcinales archaeon]
MIIIIGAGPAGTSLGKKLAENGIEVKIYDRRKEIGVPVMCGEGLDEKTQDLIGKIPEKCIAQKIKGARVYAPNGKYLEIVLKHGGFVLNRELFDQWMAEQAINAGAKLQKQTLVTDLIKENNFVKGIKGEYLENKFEERANLVVCATGSESFLRGFSCKLNLIDTCLQYEMSGIDINSDFIHIYMGNQVAPRGYAWIFPKGKDKANVGLGVIPREKTPKYYLDKFIQSKPEIRKGSILRVNGGCVPVGGFLENMVDNGFLICGEAAHHVNPIHGGGIKEAIISGQLAGDVIIQANDFSKESLEPFNKKWWEIRGYHLRKVEKLREVIERLNDK